MQRVAASVKIWWLNGRAPPRFVDSVRRPVCFYLFIGWKWIIYQSAVFVRRIIIVCGRLELYDFFLFFWPRRQRHPASVRVISVSLSWGGFKASSALDFGCTYYKACINICIQFIHAISMKPSVFERTKSYDAFIPTLMKHNRYLSSSQLWCDLILLVFPIKDQEPPPTPSPIFTFLHSRSIEFQSVISVFMTESCR